MYVLFCEGAEDFRARAPEPFAARRAGFLHFHAAGRLPIIGPFTDPAGGAMGVFTSREAASQFAGGDPSVLFGVVRGWYVREWNEVLSGA